MSMGERTPRDVCAGFPRIRPQLELTVWGEASQDRIIDEGTG